MALPSSTGRFRQRKISVKQSLDVMKQKDMPDLDSEEQQRELQHFDTGVEKGEEQEKDLQAVMKASEAQLHGSDVKEVSIRTPDASKMWTTPAKFYLTKFSTPEDYIKSSSTVEDTGGCPYNMDEVDEEFLTKYNKGKTGAKKCTEDEFEILMANFERIVDKKQPFLSMDPKQVLTYDEIREQALVPDKADPGYVAMSLGRDLGLNHFRTLLDYPTKVYPRPLRQLLDLFGNDVYPHWKERRLSRGGKPIFATLKFEEPGQKDDNDPYICFRRREYRHARKTRRADLQGVEKLRLLDRDLRAAKHLLTMVAQRELKRMTELAAEHTVFQERCQFKEIKRSLGISGDDELLIDHRRKRAAILKAQRAKEAAAAAAAEREKEKERQRRIKVEKHRSHHRQEKSAAVNPGRHQDMSSAAPVPVQPYVKLPSAKIPDLEMATVNTVLHDKLDRINKAVSDKLIRRKLQDEGWVNFTDDGYNPFFDISPDGEEKVKERSHLPFSSICASNYRIEDSRPIEFSALFNNGKHYSSNDQDVIKINASTGQVVRNDRHNAMPRFYEMSGEDGDDSTDSGLNVGSLEESYYDKNRLNVSGVRFKLRKRLGRNGLSWVDRKRVTEDPETEEEEKAVEPEDETSPVADKSSDSAPPPPSKKRRINAYDSLSSRSRVRSRYLFDDDLPPISQVDPARLNAIGSQTQEIRFGAMLLSKAYENMHQIRQKQLEAYQQQRLLHQQKIMQQRQQQAKIAAEKAAAAQKKKPIQKVVGANA